MAPVHIKLFLALVFLVGVGFCQNATNTTGAAATPTVASSTSASTTTSSSRPSVTSAIFSMAAAVPLGFLDALKYGLTAVREVIQKFADHKKLQ